MTEATPTAPTESPAVGHALDILGLLARHTEPLPAARIASALGLPRSSTYRMLTTLTDRGFVSHLRESGRFALGAAAYELGCNAVPVMIPLGRAGTFEGLIALTSMQAIYFDDPQSNGFRVAEIPPDKREKALKWRANLVEKCAEQDDALMEKFFAVGDLTEAEIWGILRKATIARRIVPVFCGAAFKNKGIKHLLDGVVHLLPAPNEIPPIISAWEEGEDLTQREPEDDAPFSALAFKIVADKHAGKLTYLRIYSGTLVAGQNVLNSTQDKIQRIGRILRMHANHSENLETAQTGDIVAVVGLAHTRTGDTICD